MVVDPTRHHHVGGIWDLCSLSLLSHQCERPTGQLRCNASPGLDQSNEVLARLKSADCDHEWPRDAKMGELHVGHWFCIEKAGGDTLWGNEYPLARIVVTCCHFGGDRRGGNDHSGGMPTGPRIHDRQSSVPPQAVLRVE